MAIQITWTNTATGLSETNTWLDDATTARMLAWAKAAYPNADGTPAGNAAAVRRASRSFINGLKDATRKSENDASVAAVAAPAPIDVVP